MKTPKISAIVLAAALLAGCGGTGTGNPEVSLTEDTSASGAVAGAVGGSLSSTSSNSTLTWLEGKKPTLFAKAYDRFFPDAWASGSCPTFLTTQGSGCSASGGTMWLTYSACQFGGKGSYWTGTQALIMSSGTASCGTFPSAANITLTRQYTSGASTTPSSVAVTSAYGTTAYIDNHTTNLSNFDNDTISTLANGGYGSQVAFDGTGARTSLTIAARLWSGSFDHTVSGTVSITESAGAHTRTISGGPISVYHNGLRVVGSSSFNNVTHSDSCCFPISGSITTTFQHGNSVSPTALGNLAVGKSEKLTFTGCGTAELQSYDGSIKEVALTRCF